MLTNLATNPTTERDMLAIREATGRGATAGLKPKGKALADKIDDASGEFEAQFIAQMMSSMFATLEPNEELGGGDAEEVYQSLLVSEYGKVIARTGGIGVSAQVKQIMIEQQGVQ